MSYIPDNPLIIQTDRSILLEVHSPFADAARTAIAPFAELVKSPEHIHTYKLTPLSIWNARASGMEIGEMLTKLTEFSKFPVPEMILQEIQSLGQRYGMTVLQRPEQNTTPSEFTVEDGEFEETLVLSASEKSLAELLAHHELVAPLIKERLSDTDFSVSVFNRGLLKQALLSAGYPARDIAGYVTGSRMPVTLRTTTDSGQPFEMRQYQQEAVAAFYAGGSSQGGSGVIVLPCGAGKTIVGMAAMAAVGENTLILTTGQTSINQWRREILDKTNVPADKIAEYTGSVKETGPITLSTYQILSWRATNTSDFPHFGLLRQREWGLIIYDEVHLLPAEVFRITAELQARRRLGLTATLIREDGREGDVFALIGPKRYDVPWRDLEEKGFVATAECAEIRVPMSEKMRMEYALAPRRLQFRVASENPAKIDTVKNIIALETANPNKHQARILIIGEFISQLDLMAKETSIPLVTGKTPQAEREELYEKFRHGQLPALILSRVGNFALDLPDADVLIQISGKYGSRQEEAQRLGRVLRPKKDGGGARFYTLVSQQTCEEDFARNRQLFLTEQGYAYRIEIIPS